MAHGVARSKFPSPPLLIHVTHHSLAAFVHVDVLNDDLLLTAPSQLLEGLCEPDTEPRELLELPRTAGPLASWHVPIPSDCSLLGLKVYTQAVHILGVTPFALSNTQDLVIGY